MDTITNRHAERQTDRLIPVCIPPKTFVLQGYKKLRLFGNGLTYNPVTHNYKYSLP